MKVQVNSKDAIWNAIGTLFSLGSGLIIIPIILIYLSDDATALYYIFTSLGAIATLFDFGFSPSIARNMMYAYTGTDHLEKTGLSKNDNNSSKPNFQLMTVIVATCKLIYTVLALFALIIALTAGTRYIEYLSHGQNSDEFIIAWIIYSIAIYLNLQFSYYTVFLRGIGEITRYNQSIIISKVIQILLSCIFLFNGFGLIGISVAYLFYGCSFRVLASYFFYHQEIIKGKILKTKVDKEQVKGVLSVIWPNAWKDGLVTLSNFLLNQATTIIAPFYLTLQQTGTYSLCMQLASAVVSIAYSVHNAFQPVFQAAYANRDLKQQKDTISITVTSFIVLTVVISIVLVTLGLPVVHILKPSYEISVLLLICSIISQSIYKFRDCYCSFISCTNNLVYYKSYVLSSVLCVVLLVIFTGKLNFGVYGLVLSQIVSQAVYNMWHWTKIVNKQLKLTMKTTISNGIRQIFKIMSEHHR